MSYKKLLVAILFAIVLLGGGMFLNNQKQQPPKEGDNTSDQPSETVSPTAEVENTKLEVRITSPTEETFQPRQARMWSADILNFKGMITRFASCEWRFYLNENNSEALYQEQVTRAVLSEGKENTCGFTSTFIEKRGKLRVEVTVIVKDLQENELERYTAERNYIVQ
ncbi:MAG: hypothetical protein QY312_00615 [Candidatus Dojkabacteria bacterium]|nr:MAG: hypothetical protein QY312_00615 [Candidatus Dojkabacteria bacterium]